ncbi:MAG: peptide chain release factor 1 [Candidatus Handelsmanbacteria bacterium]|nr:peptide chain release factor 1 [Candidatus Handelsmanbacteria bacterium]
MLDKLCLYEKRYQELNERLADPATVQNTTNFQKLAKEAGDLREIAELAGRYRKLLGQLEDVRQLLAEEQDAELHELAQAEAVSLGAEVEGLERELRVQLVPRDPSDGRNAIIEIRAGTGGDEAGLFAADLYRMYTRLAERHNWKIEPLASSTNPAGGFKEVIFLVSGKDAFGKLKFESGVHRVQRVPKTEANGRIHTSAASVAVLPEAEEVDIQIDPEDLQIDVYRSGGPGGQSVNTTDSAVRITHIPTGIVVSCQDEKSQLKNKNKALKVLRARLLDRYQAEQDKKISEARKQQIGSGDRSAKIRTYNFPQGRFTDHRIGLTLYRLEEVLDGDLDEVVQQLTLAAQENALAVVGEEPA